MSNQVEHSKRRASQALRKDEINYMSFFEQYSCSQQGRSHQVDPNYFLKVSIRVDGSYEVSKNSERLFFPAKIGLVWTKEMAIHLAKGKDKNARPLNIEDLQNLKKTLSNLTQHLEIFKTTLEEIVEKLADLERNDPLIKYMKKVVNMLKQDVRSFDDLLVEPYRTQLARQVDAFIVPYEEMKNYFRKPGPVLGERFHAIVAALKHQQNE